QRKPRSSPWRFDASEIPYVIAEQALGDQQHAIESAPQHERPRRAMPQPAQEKREDQVGMAAQPAATVVAERREHIVAQPARQRDVPSIPQVDHADRAERTLEVGLETESEHQRDADRAKRVTGKVAVDL